MTKYNIGIDLGGTKVLGSIVDIENRKILFEVKKKTKKDKGNEKVISKVFEVIDELFEESKIKKDDINIISIATAGQVDRENGILINAVNLDCRNLKIKELIEEKYNIKTYLLNDVEAATIAEILMGAGKNYNNILCVFIGTGIGSSIVINKKIYKGSGFAGELGHMIIQKDGRECVCGENGCLEAYSSRTAIENYIRASLKKGEKSIITEFCDEQNISTKYIKKALDANDDVVSRAINTAIDYLSNSIASVMNFLNPELIIFGGGVIKGIDEIYSRTVRLSKIKALKNIGSETKFKKSELGDYSGVYGASLIEEYIHGK